MKSFIDGDTLFVAPDNFKNLQESAAYPATVKDLAKALALAISLNIDQSPELDSWFSYHIEVNPEDFSDEFAGQPAPFAGPINVIISPRDDLMQPPINIYNTTHVNIDEKVIQKIVSSVILELRVMGQQTDEKRQNRRGGNNRPARFRE